MRKRRQFAPRMTRRVCRFYMNFGFFSEKNRKKRNSFWMKMGRDRNKKGYLSSFLFFVPGTGF